MSLFHSKERPLKHGASERRVGHYSKSENIELSVVPKSHRSSDHLMQSTTDDESVEMIRKHDPGDDIRDIESKWPQKSTGLFEGWKFTLSLAFTTSVVVLLFNLAFLIYTASQQGKDPSLSRGDCDKVHNVSTGFHWVINSLSTLLLAASNFGMQCLVAPTRNDIDRAHSKQRWLDIGVPSIRNLFRVSFSRSVLWFFLLFSSLPLHVFYNSAIFYKTAVPAYDIFAGPNAFEHLQWSDVLLSNEPANSTKYESLKGMFYAAKKGTLKQLDNRDCVTAFAQAYQMTYRKLLVVTEDNSSVSYELIGSNSVYQGDSSSTSTGATGAMAAYPWLCPPDVTVPACSSNGISVTYDAVARDDWKVTSQWQSRPQGGNLLVSGSRVQYCLAEYASQNCSLQYSVPLTVATVVCNIVKACVLLYIWLGIKEAPILTVGDAIASFLRHEDVYSKGVCLPTDGTGRYIPGTRATPHSLYNNEFRRPVAFTHKRSRWGTAVSSRWGFFIFFWIVAILICILLLLISVLGITHGGLGKLGAISSQTMIDSQDSGDSLVSNSFIANLPQLIFSFLYVAYNSILTSMCLSAEYSVFGNDRKGLRVSHSPKLSQRSNYFLSIPYRFAIPLIVTSAALHWLASQSLFMIAIEAYDTKLQRDPANDLYACGYSPVAIISGLAVAITMFTCLIVLSFRRFESAIPVAASCSLAIAAACHPHYNPNQNSPDALARTEVKGAGEMESEQEEEDMALLPVKWGAIPVDGPGGHCSFTSAEVYPLEEGKEYQ